MELNVKNIKAINKAISSLQNSWAYFYDDGCFRYSYVVKNQTILETKRKYVGICYSTVNPVGVNNEQLKLWFEKYKHLI